MVSLPLRAHIFQTAVANKSSNSAEAPIKLILVLVLVHRLIKEILTYKFPSLTFVLEEDSI